MGNYFIYTNTKKEIGCPRFDKVDDVIKKYQETEMESMTDNVFLGYESGRDICFDIVHKFFGKNILINDYLNHDEKEVAIAVEEIKRKMYLHYQWTPDILSGALIDYVSPFAPYKGEIKEETWNEAYVSTLVDGHMEIVGWVSPTRDTFNNYGWNYPKTASHISMMNVSVYDENGHKHDVDVDPRVYLQLAGKKVSI